MITTNVKKCSDETEKTQFFKKSKNELYIIKILRKISDLFNRFIGTAQCPIDGDASFRAFPTIDETIGSRLFISR